jgi:hypothetical protein
MALLSNRSSIASALEPTTTAMLVCNVKRNNFKVHYFASDFS